MRNKIKSKECELNILVNQKSLVELERSTEMNKQKRTIAKLKKELKNVQSQTKKIEDDSANVSNYLKSTHVLLDEADVQEADMKGQIEEIKQANENDCDFEDL